MQVAQNNDRNEKKIANELIVFSWLKRQFCVDELTTLVSASKTSSEITTFFMLPPALHNSFLYFSMAAIRFSWLPQRMMKQSVIRGSEICSVKRISIALNMVNKWKHAAPLMKFIVSESTFDAANCSLPTSDRSQVKHDLRSYAMSDRFAGSFHLINFSTAFSGTKMLFSPILYTRPSLTVSSFSCSTFSLFLRSY